MNIVKSRCFIDFDDEATALMVLQNVNIFGLEVAHRSKRFMRHQPITPAAATPATDTPAYASPAVAVPTCTSTTAKNLGSTLPAATDLESTSPTVMEPEFVPPAVVGSTSELPAGEAPAVKDADLPHSSVSVPDSITSIGYLDRINNRWVQNQRIISRSLFSLGFSKIVNPQLDTL